MSNAGYYRKRIPSRLHDKSVLNKHSEADGFIRGNHDVTGNPTLASVAGHCTCKSCIMRRPVGLCDHLWYIVYESMCACLI